MNAQTAGMSRRRLLQLPAFAAAGAGAAALLAKTAKTAAAAGGAAGAPAAPAAELPVAKGRLVCVFLRGGMDGMSAVPPLGDARYQALRPTIAIPEASALALDPMFGLHPAMKGLAELYRSKELAIVHAVGNGTESRSHFEAQAHVELGGPTAPSSGWLTRYLAATRSATDSPLRAVALNALTPNSLRGCTSCMATTSVAGEGASLGGASGLLAPYPATLGALYASDPLGVADAADDALAALKLLEKIAPTSSTSSTSSTSGSVTNAATAAVARRGGPNLSAALADVTAVFKADIGVEVCCVDTGGWDTHNNMGSATEGAMFDLLEELSSSLATFYNGLSTANINDVTVVVISEFGRRAAENGSGGLDHGSANAMFVLGPNLAGGGKVHANWPGLADDKLYRGDLVGTTDYRSVLAEVIEHRLGVPAGAATVFPGTTTNPVGAA